MNGNNKQDDGFSVSGFIFGMIITFVVSIIIIVFFIPSVQESAPRPKVKGQTKEKFAKDKASNKESKSTNPKKN